MGEGTSPSDELFERALSLPEAARARLARRLLETLPAPGADDDDAWAAEIDRRAEQFFSGETQGIPADEVFRLLDEPLKTRLK